MFGNKRFSPPIASAYGKITKLALQTIPNNVKTQIQFDVRTFSYRVIFDAANFNFVISESGVYIVGLMGNWALNAVGLRQFVIDINGGTFDNFIYSAALGLSNQPMSVKTIPIPLQVNDVIGGYVQQTSGGNLNFSNPLMTIVKITDVVIG